MRQLTTLFSVSVLSMAVLTGCAKQAEEAPKQEANADAAAASAEGLNIKVATEGAYKPFNYVDKEGKPVGFDIDITNALCEQMKANCEIVMQDWDGIIPGLIAKKYDAIIAGMSVTEERKQKVDFSAPYFKNTLIFVGKVGDATDVATISGKKIGAQGSTIASQHAEDNFAANNEIKTYKTQEDAYSDLKSGRIDFLFSDKVPAIDWLKTENGTGYEVKGAEIDINDNLAIAVRKGEPLKGQFDAALAEIQANGKYQTIYDSYFK